MSRPYPPEPVTHYDGNDPHTYDLHCVIEPDCVRVTDAETELDQIVASLERDNIVHIGGVAHELTLIGPLREDGTREAELKIVRPF